VRKYLDEIVESWFLDSKFEKNDRYFFHTNIVEKIMRGRISYIIGRKGTGKTAISEYILNLSKENTFAQKLTFKNFPFNELYKLSDARHTQPNQYITIWKYVIYSTICKIMIESSHITQDTKDKLQRIFGNDDITKALPNAIQKWTAANFSLSFISAGISRTSESNPISWIDKVEIIERFIMEKYPPTDKYIIMFDELDEDYKDIAIGHKYNEYFSLITGLFKATQDIRSKFKEKHIYPLILLRDDIYDLIKDNDKTKWKDFSETLDWNENSIKKLLAFRFTRVIDPNAQDIQNFNSAWKELFSNGEIRYGTKGRKGADPFDYIAKNTLSRPRDYIQYLKICASLSLNNENQEKISPDIVKKANKEFSNYLKSELVDEIHGIIPDIDEILNVFRSIRKQTLSISEFKKIFNNQVKLGSISTRDFNKVISALFYFSIIGNQPTQKNHPVFRYKNKEATINFNEQIIIHQGLFRALQIL
jgi:hypothetical protein